MTAPLPIGVLDAVTDSRTTSPVAKLFSIFSERSLEREVRGDSAPGFGSTYEFFATLKETLRTEAAYRAEVRRWRVAEERRKNAEAKVAYRARRLANAPFVADVAIGKRTEAEPARRTAIVRAFAEPLRMTPR